jgi:integrase
MPGKTRKVPSYRLHKPTGQAVVRLDGRDHYLGKYGSDESQEKYGRVIAEWLAAGKARVPAPAPAPAGGCPADEMTVNEVVLAFLTRHADSYYRHADGTPTGEAENFKDALRPLRKLYGRTLAKDFGPLALKAVRGTMIDGGLARSTINARMSRIVRVFAWGVENELVPASVHHGLKAVPGLKKGRSGARESPPVTPVPEAHVDAVRPHVSRQVWAMIQLQRLTGMRPGEVTMMRTCDLDMTGEEWIYRPRQHKTEHRDKGREIPLGPKAREVLRPWLRTDLEAPLFQPREATEERNVRCRAGRQSPMTPSQRARRRKRAPSRAPGDHYDVRAYCHAIRRGCARAFPHPTLSRIPKKELTPEQRLELMRWHPEEAWHPNQLRHNLATRLRKEFGLDVARAVLGHSDAATTTIYAERDKAIASEAMRRVG